MVQIAFLISSHKVSESNGAVTIQIVRHGHFTLTTLMHQVRSLQGPLTRIAGQFGTLPSFRQHEPRRRRGFLGKLLRALPAPRAPVIEAVPRGCEEPTLGKSGRQ